MPIERNNPVVCYVTGGSRLREAERGQVLRETIRKAIAAGVDWVQVREKDLSGKALLDLVRDAVGMARAGVYEGKTKRTRVIVNDRLDVAVAAGAAGVHLGGQSLPVRDVNTWRRAGNASAEFLIGASCHSASEARAAENDGADYIFFGPMFETPDKLKFGAPQGLENLREACCSVKIPVIAIGGVNAENAEDCLRAGAAGIAAIRMLQEAGNENVLCDAVAHLHRIS